MRVLNWRKITTLAGVVLLANCRIGSATPCVGHGGPSGCDAASGHVLCGDGTIDKSAPCSKGKRKKSPHVRVLKFKPPPTDKGQILNPGQKPPDTTLEKSK